MLTGQAYNKGSFRNYSFVDLITTVSDRFVDIVSLAPDVDRICAQILGVCCT